MKVWKYDWEIGWYETNIEECTIELSSSYTKIEDLMYYTLI